MQHFHTRKTAAPAFQHSEDARAQYLLEVGIYKPDIIVFVDEPG